MSVLRFEAGYPLAEARLGPTPVHLIIDSGSPFNVIDEEVLIDAGARSTDIEVPILGAIPRPECRSWAEVYEIDVSIGHDHFTEVKFVGHDIGWHGRGLLGHEILRHCTLELDWPSGTIQLTRSL